MAEKSKVSQKKIDEIQALQTETAASIEDASRARKVEAETVHLLKQKMNALRVSIAAGVHTTGDHILDINIVVNESVTKDAMYDAMVRLEESLQPHGGELAASVSSWAGTPQVEVMGFLPEAPRLLQRVGAAFGRGRVFGGDASVQAVIPVLSQAGIVNNFLAPKWERSQDDLTLGNNIIFEDKIQWILENEPNMHLAVKLWSESLELGRPLRATGNVLSEIMIRREGCAQTLTRLATELSAAITAFQKTQEEPTSWLHSQIKTNGREVVVSFPAELARIKRARKELSGEISVARRLGMGEDRVSPSYRNATELYDAIGSWDD